MLFITSWLFIILSNTQLPIHAVSSTRAARHLAHIGHDRVLQDLRTLDLLLPRPCQLSLPRTQPLAQVGDLPLLAVQELTVLH